MAEFKSLECVRLNCVWRAWEIKAPLEETQGSKGLIAPQRMPQQEHLAFLSFPTSPQNLWFWCSSASVSLSILDSFIFSLFFSCLYWLGLQILALISYPFFSLFQPRAISPLAQSSFTFECTGPLVKTWAFHIQPNSPSKAFKPNLSGLGEHQANKNSKHLTQHILHTRCYSTCIT